MNNYDQWVEQTKEEVRLWKQESRDRQNKYLICILSYISLILFGVFTFQTLSDMSSWFAICWIVVVSTVLLLVGFAYSYESYHHYCVDRFLKDLEQYQQHDGN